MTAPAKTRGTRRKAAAPAFQEPLPQIEPGRPRQHNGISVVREELLSSPLGVGKFRISRLHLSDGTSGYACRDCLFTADKRGEVQVHRNEKHGSNYGHRKSRVITAKDTGAVLGDLVLPPRPDGEPAPTDPMSMTLAEILALMPSISALADYVDKMERERDYWKDQFKSIQLENNRNAHAVAVHESLQEEVVDLRLKLKTTGSYEEMKAELLTLREFKKKTIARLKTLGFVMAEEEE